MTDLSIIIPHYNSVNSLEKLIKSIPESKDIQIIVVDDRSNQHPRDKLSIESLNRITLLDNQSKKVGAGVCRNIGLKHAVGNWVLFADADDYFLEGFYPIIQKYFFTNYEVIFFKSTSINLITNEQSTRHRHVEKTLNNYLMNHDLKSELCMRYRIYPPWAKLFKRNFINDNNIRFDELIVSNDVMFSIRAGYAMHNFLVADDVIYCITRNPHNITMNISEAIFDTRVAVFLEKYNYLEKRLEENQFKLLEIHGWWYVIHALTYKLGLNKAKETYRVMRQNKVEMCVPRVYPRSFQFKKVSVVY